MNIDSPKVSVLVPVYKVEAYLQRCIDSVLAQDFQDWELILVDDGSPDRCPQICDEAARKDSRIIVVHKENGGLPSARLAGFERAKSEYLVFLDSDDWLLDGALTTLYEAITSDGGYDVVRAQILRCDEIGNKWIEHYEKEDGEIGTNKDFLNCLNAGIMAPYIHSGIYRQSLFSNNTFQILINNNLSIGEDAIVTTIISSNIHRVRYIDKPVSVYYLNSNSIVNTVVRSISYNRRIRNVLKTFRTDVEKGMLDEMAVWEDMKSFFTPELYFDWEFYKQYRDLFPLLKTRSYNSYPSRYFWFIKYPFLYYAYTRLFCFIYKWIKLKGKKRKVIM